MTLGGTLASEGFAVKTLDKGQQTPLPSICMMPCCGMDAELRPALRMTRARALLASGPLLAHRRVHPIPLTCIASLPQCIVSEPLYLHKRELDGWCILCRGARHSVQWEDPPYDAQRTRASRACGRCCRRGPASWTPRRARCRASPPVSCRRRSCRSRTPSPRSSNRSVTGLMATHKASVRAWRQ